MRLLKPCDLLLLASTLSLAGCLPATWTVVPEVRGRVLMPTGEPAADAQVILTQTPSLAKMTVPVDASSQHREIAVTTDAQGQFHRKEETHWTMELLLPLDAMAPDFVATASHAGLRSAPMRFSGGITNPHYLGLTNKNHSFDLGDLMLQPPALNEQQP